MKHLKLKGVGLLFLGFLTSILPAFAMPPEGENIDSLTSPVASRGGIEIDPLFTSQQSISDVSAADEEWIPVRAGKKHSKRHQKKKSLQKRLGLPASVKRQWSEDSDSGIILSSGGIEVHAPDSEWKLVSVRNPEGEDSASSQFYYHLGLTEILPPAQKGGAFHLQGPVLRFLKKKECQVMVSAQFGEPDGEEGQTFYGSAPTVWDQDPIVLKRQADNLFPVLGDLLKGLRLTSLDLSRCCLEEGHLNDIFGSIGYLTHLDLSHNGLTTVPPALEGWFRHRGRHLKSLNVGHNPWKEEALRSIRLALKRSPVHTLALQKVGLRVGWNVLQGFFGEEGYENLSHLDIRGNPLHVKVSSLLGGLLTRPSFSLLLDDFRVEVDPQKKKKKRTQPLGGDGEEGVIEASSLPVVHLIHAGRTVETVTLPDSVSLEMPLLRKLMPLKVEHLEILGEAIHPLRSISELFSLADLKTLKLGASALNAPGVMERIAKGWVYHRHLSKLFLNGGEDLSLGSAETLLYALTKDHTEDLSWKGRKMLKRFQKQISGLETSPEPLTPVQTKEKEKKERKVSELTGKRPLTLVFPTQLSPYEARLQGVLKSVNAAHIKVEFSDQ